MWRTGITMGIGWLALIAGFINMIIDFSNEDWGAGITRIVAGVVVIAITTGIANLLTRTINPAE